MKKLTAALLAMSCFSGVAMAHDAGEFFVRAGTATVRPNAGSDDVLKMGNFQVDNNTQLGVTMTWMATENIGVELLAATPFEHKVGLGATGQLATVHHLPPTLMAQWYFGDSKSKLRPYLGAGVNYTTFFDNKFNQTGKDAQLTDLSLKDSWGLAGQAGVDYLINKNWLINMSVWYMDIDTTVKFKAAGEEQNIKTRLDPWVFMFSAGYRF